MFVMNFMSSPDGFKIEVVRFSKKFKSLMNKNIMHKEVRESIDGNAKTNPK